jgi:hypothetical protein
MRSTIITRITQGLLAIGVLSSALVFAAVAQNPEGPVEKKTPEPVAWTPPSVDRVKDQTLVWLKTTDADATAKAKVETLWQDVSKDATSGELLSQLTESFALANAEAAKLVELCSTERRTVVLPDCEWLKDEKTEPLMAANLRLLYGRWLVQQLLFDEAAEQIVDLKPDEVVDPASLLFYQAVIHHRLLDQKSGLAAAQSLIEGAEHSPQRYVAVARLIRGDLVGLKEDTLDHIARRMEDIERRLDLGRAGPRVRGIEDGVIESLDKLIKEIEEGLQSSSSSGMGSDNIQSSKPAQDSQIMGGKGPGNVTKRGVGNTAGWGDLPPKQREEALQQIGREFPAHYRDVIEQYFRRLAAE